MKITTSLINTRRVLRRCFIIAGSFVLRYTKSMSKNKAGVTLGAKSRIVIAIIIIGSFGGMLAIGWLYAGVKQPNERVVVSKDICNDSLVAKYNESLSDTTKLKGLVSTITSKNGSDSDASCLYMRYYYLALSNTGSQTDELNNTYHKIATLADKGIYPSPKLQTMTSLQQMEALRGGVTQNNQGKPQ